MKKDDVLALLANLPDEFDATQLIYTLSLKHKVERAEADLAAGRCTPGEGAELSDWEQRRRRHLRTIEVLTRVSNNKELMDRVTASLEASDRGERGTPFRQIQEEARRRRGEG